MIDNLLVMILSRLRKIKTTIDTVQTNTAKNNTASNTGTLSQKLSYIIATLIGATNNTGGSATAGTVMAKLNGIFTNAANAATNATNASTYAKNAQTYTATNNTASKTGILSQKAAYLIALLENTTYGLSALKTAINKSGNIQLAGELKTLSGTYTPTTNAESQVCKISNIYIPPQVSREAINRANSNLSSGASSLYSIELSFGRFLDWNTQSYLEISLGSGSYAQYQTVTVSVDGSKYTLKGTSKGGSLRVDLPVGVQISSILITVSSTNSSKFVAVMWNITSTCPIYSVK